MTKINILKWSCRQAVAVKIFAFFSIGASTISFAFANASGDWSEGMNDTDRIGIGE